MSILNYKIKKFIYFIITFLLIYRPFYIFHINSYIFTFGIFVVFSVIDLLNKGKYMFSHIKKKTIFFFILGIILSMIYCVIRVLMNNSLPHGLLDLRIPQHLIIIIHLLIAIFIINRLKSFGYSQNKLIEFILNVATLQGLICLIMILVPSLRTYALNAFVNTTRFNAGDYILNVRVYGLSDSYTYGLPITNGLLTGLCFFYSSTSNKKMLISLPFILLVSILNGRTGVLIGLLSVGIIVLLINSKNKIKAILYGTLILFFLIISLQIIQSINPNMYRFINKIFSIFSSNNSTVTYLTKTALFFPKGLYFLFGMGFRVYGGLDTNFIDKVSDIGYVNYMFLGGILYLLLFVGSFILLYLRSFINKERELKSYKVLKYILLISSAIACLKGEIFNNMNYVFTTFMICLILLSSNNGVRSDLEND